MRDDSVHTAVPGCPGGGARGAGSPAISLRARGAYRILINSVTVTGAGAGKGRINEPELFVTGRFVTA